MRVVLFESGGGTWYCTVLGIDISKALKMKKTEAFLLLRLLGRFTSAKTDTHCEW